MLPGRCALQERHSPGVAVPERRRVGRSAHLRPAEWFRRHGPNHVFQLLPHCTERTCAPAALAEWPRVFERLGLQLQILNSGCCGMAGTYGHQAEHRETSKQIYDISWRQHVGGASGRLLATGYSCRSQVKRFDRSSLPHPVQALLEVLRQHGYARG